MCGSLPTVTPSSLPLRRGSAAPPPPPTVAGCGKRQEGRQRARGGALPSIGSSGGEAAVARRPSRQRLSPSAAAAPLPLPHRRWSRSPSCGGGQGRRPPLLRI
uniref:Uncharacterized protein n=1 Tax=Oryza barthii TaxID=65489 RepID=A0A0D3FZN5_9ORYZ